VRSADRGHDAQPKVIGIGCSYLDHLFVLPSLDRLSRESCGVLEIRTQGGGQIATAMVAVARLGAMAHLWSRIGDDATGSLIVEGLKKEGVDTSQVQVVPGGTSPTSFIAVDGETGERRIFWSGGANLEEAEAGNLDLSRIAEVGSLLVDSSWADVGLLALDVAQNTGTPSCADFGSISERTVPLIERLDVLIVPEHCAQEFIGQDDHEAAAKGIQKLGPATVVVTLGPRGCLVRDRDETYHQGAFPVKAVDTTGAGDAFHGAYAYAMARGWNTRHSVIFASAAAALKCRKLGGRTGLPALGEVIDFLRERGVPCHWCR